MSSSVRGGFSVRSLFTSSLAGLMVVSLLTWASAADWTEFRGPNGQGVTEIRHLPLSWSKTEHVVWRQELPGKGWSSPVLLGKRIYLTSAIPGEKPATGEPSQSLHALCLDAETGTVIWDHEIFQQPAGQRIHSKNSHASATPITDGKVVYVHFGTHGTACLNLEDGKAVWKTTELKYVPQHGNGGSPILVDDKLVLSCDGTDVQFIVALDRATGKIVWKTPRSVKPAKGFAFCTPLLIEVNGKRQIVSGGPDAVYAYDPQDGKEIWYCRYKGGYSVVPRPVFGKGMVFLSSGYDTPRFLAIKTDGQGDVTDTHIAWELKRGAPLNPSPLLVGDEIYLVADNGIATCLDAATGKQHWQERIGGNFSSSPLAAEGRIYLQSEEGVGIVLKASTTFEELSRNDLGERTLASYAVAEDGSLLIRTEQALVKVHAAESK